MVFFLHPHFRISFAYFFFSFEIFSIFFFIVLVDLYLIRNNLKFTIITCVSVSSYSPKTLYYYSFSVLLFRSVCTSPDLIEWRHISFVSMYVSVCLCIFVCVCDGIRFMFHCNFISYPIPSRNLFAV